jgi:hypothetical protein
MKLRRRTWLFLALTLLVGGIVSLPEVRWRLIGWFRQEASYQGMPTSWWEREIRDSYLLVDATGGPTYLADPSPSTFGRLAEIFGLSEDPLNTGAAPPLLTGNSSALPVLVELLKSKELKVRHFAVEGLANLGRKARPAGPDLLDAFLAEEDTDCKAKMDALLKRINPERRRRPGLRRSPVD